MVENDLTQVSIHDGEEKILLKKAPAPQIAPASVSPGTPAHPLGAVAPPPGSAGEPPPKTEEEDIDAGLLTVPSPMVGTFYSAPDPSSPPYVKAGDIVTPDAVVCIIEAMKVFNEIKAGVTGRIERVLVANETAVEYGQTLFLVRAS